MSDQAKTTVVVTGGSRGLGRAICLAFAGPDTHIYSNYNSSQTSADETADLIAGAGGTSTFKKVDVSSLAQVSGFVKHIVRESGGIQVLVNNAGITRDGLVAMMKETDWDDVIETNLKGAFNCIKAASRQMMKQRFGRIINITSVVGVTGNPGQANYAASKAGIIGLTKSIARELAPRGITVNAVAPGYVETDMTATLPEKAKAAMLGMIPLGRPGKPEEIAAMVRFLASEHGGYITGQVLHVSGGMYI
jgi:3-oxoacyl-[acyl-carrier protein] reductase